MKKILLIVLCFVLVFLMTSCTKSEEVIISKYFQAMGLNDRDTMTSMAVEPKKVEYKSYKIVSIDEPEISEYALPLMVENLSQLKNDRNKQLELVRDKKDELDELEFELEETRRSSKKRELRKKIDETNQLIDEETEKFKEMVVKISKEKDKIEMERSLIKLSAGIESNAEIYSGETHNTKVVVKVTLNDGSEKDYVFLLRRYLVKVQDKILGNRYLILKIMTADEFEQEKQKEEATITETEEVSEETTQETQE